jgi:hypothetical protein
MRLMGAGLPAPTAACDAGLREPMQTLAVRGTINLARR